MKSTLPVITAFSEGTDGAIAVAGTTPASPPEIYAVDASGTRQLTHHNAWLDDIALSTAAAVTSKSDDGTEVHGILRKQQATA